MSEAKEVITLVLSETAATRKYPFTRDTLDKIKEIRGKLEDDLKEETGKEYLVPAPMVLEAAVNMYHCHLFQETK